MGDKRTGRAKRLRLETMDLDGRGVESKPSNIGIVCILGFTGFGLFNQELSDLLALVALELNHLTQLRVGGDATIAGELLLDELEDLLPVKPLRKTLDGSQGLSAIALLNPYMDVLFRLLSLAGFFVSFGEGVAGFEVFD